MRGVSLLSYQTPSDMNNVLFLNMCPLDPNATVSPYSNITWAQATVHPVQQYPGPAYLRADIGGALLPWVYTIVVLLIHIPVVIIRVVRWQTVQIWCLVATLFTIAVTIQAYVSTGFRAQEILTWTPLLLVIDAGSMAQVLCLIVEQFSLLTRLRHAYIHAAPFKHGHKANEPADPDHRSCSRKKVNKYRSAFSVLVQPILPTLRHRRPRWQLQHLSRLPRLPEGSRMHFSPRKAAIDVAQRHRRRHGYRHPPRIHRRDRSRHREQRDPMEGRQDAEAVVYDDCGAGDLELAADVRRHL